MEPIERIKLDEGFRPYPYLCTGGALTIGYGRNIDRDSGGLGLREIEASFMMRNDLIEAERDLQEIFPGWSEIDPVRQGAFLNMRFQLGGAGFRSFRNMIEAAKRGAWSLASGHALDSRWAYQTPSRAYRVVEEIKNGVSV